MHGITLTSAKADWQVCEVVRTKWEHPHAGRPMGTPDFPPVTKPDEEGDGGSYSLTIVSGWASYIAAVFTPFRC